MEIHRRFIFQRKNYLNDFVTSRILQKSLCFQVFLRSEKKINKQIHYVPPWRFHVLVIPHREKKWASTRQSTKIDILIMLPSSFQLMNNVRLTKRDAFFYTNEVETTVGLVVWPLH